MCSVSPPTGKPETQRGERGAIFAWDAPATVPLCLPERGALLLQEQELCQTRREQPQAPLSAGLPGTRRVHHPGHRVEDGTGGPPLLLHCEPMF